MGISIEDALKLAVSSSGYLSTVNSVEKFLFINDNESRDKVKEIREKTGPLDRGESVRDIVAVIESAIEDGKARQESVIQGILMIANAGQKKKKKKR